MGLEKTCPLKSSKILFEVSGKLLPKISYLAISSKAEEWRLIQRSHPKSKMNVHNKQPALLNQRFRNRGLEQHKQDKTEATEKHSLHKNTSRYIITISAPLEVTGNQIEHLMTSSWEILHWCYSFCSYEIWPAWTYNH